MSPNTTLANDELKFSLIVTVPFVIVDFLISLIDESLFAVKVLLFKLTFTSLFTLSPNTTLANDVFKLLLIETLPFVIVELLILLTVDSFFAVKVVLFKSTSAILFNVTLANDEVKSLLIETLPFVIVELLILLTVEPLFAVNEWLFKSTFAILFNTALVNVEVKLLLTKTSPFVIVELSILLNDDVIPSLVVKVLLFKFIVVAFKSEFVTVEVILLFNVTFALLIVESVIVLIISFSNVPAFTSTVKVLFSPKLTVPPTKFEFVTVEVILSLIVTVPFVIVELTTLLTVTWPFVSIVTSPPILLSIIDEIVDSPVIFIPLLLVIIASSKMMLSTSLISVTASKLTFPLNLTSPIISWITEPSLIFNVPLFVTSALTNDIWSALLTLTLWFSGIIILFWYW